MCLRLRPLICEGVRAYDALDEACVMAHNKLRNLHGSQPLVWSEKLGYEAQKWCEELAMNGEIQHDGQVMNAKNEGENIGVVPKISQRSEGVGPCNTLVEKWYSEERNYNYQTGLPKAPAMPVSHFAQVSQLMHTTCTQKYGNISKLFRIKYFQL